MERYTVKFRDPHDQGELAFLVLLTPTSPVSTLLAEAKRRAAKYLPQLAENDLIPHYGEEQGPILDGDDILSDMIPDPKNEIIFVTTRPVRPPNAAEEPSLLPAGTDSVGSDYKGLKIRVITPALAKKHDSTKTIPLLDGGAPIANDTTLCELKTRIAQSLGYPVENLPATEGYRECNCAFARQILNRGIWKKVDCTTHTGPAVPGQDLTYCQFHSPSAQGLMSSLCAICSDTLSNHQGRENTSPSQSRDGCHNVFLRTDTACKHVLHSQCLQTDKTWTCPSSCQDIKPDILVETDKSDECSSRFIVVYDKSKVESISVECRSKSSLLAALHSKFGSDVEEVKSVKIHQGVYEAEKDQYVIMPVVSICSRHRHTNTWDKFGETASSRESAFNEESSVDSNPSKDLDLHTSEGHIIMTNPSLTISQVNFSDCLIDDVLDIYAVERSVTRSTIRNAGKHGVFALAAHWKIPIGQSERGMAAFLSSLRVFTELVNAKKMGESTQDQILHLIHVLTKFPPAIRTMFILMQGKSPSPAECAALAQAFFEALKDIIPLEIIEGDEKRSLEGSRLLFGFLLATAKAQRGPEDQPTPYLQSFRTIDLLNAETRQRIAIPVDTSVGLVEEGYYEAHREGGILCWSNGEEPMEARSIDPQTRRLALICGGLHTEVVVLDWGLLAMLLHRGNVQLSFDSPPAFSDINSLAVCCERNGLTVVLPSALPSSRAPALTLDRNCLQAVYVGRQPCGEPGKDITIFRPTKAKEEHVDVAIITQLIAPILKTREKEKCAVFDLCGGALERTERTPDEILMFCIDCSASMNKRCDFSEFNNMDEDEAEVDDDDIDEYGDWDNEWKYDFQDEDEDEGDDVKEVFQRDLLDGDQDALIDEDISGLTLNETKQLLSDNESFDDMMAIIKQAGRYRRYRAYLLLKQFVVMYQRELTHNVERLKLFKNHAWRRHKARECEDRISWLKLAVRGINKYKETLLDFMKHSARRSNVGSRDWKWKSGEAIPNRPTPLHIAGQPDEPKLFCIPPEFICPIQHEVFEDPVIASDGFTYERRSIERWLQIRGTSPSTGLELRDTTLKHHGSLADKIKRWIAWEPFSERQSNVPKRRCHTRLSAEPYLEIHFFNILNPLASFSRKVQPSLSVKDLYRVAFQGMKGRHFNFDLRHNGALLHACLESIQERGLAQCPSVHIDLTESHENRISDKSERAGTKVESEELALVKVYKPNDNHLFSFWIPRNTKKSLASIIFRFWRHGAEQQFLYDDYDVDIWTNMEYVGDDESSGSRWEHWEPLHLLLTPMYATGTSEEGTENLVESNSSDERVLVIKLSLYQYQTRLNAHEEAAKRARKFSRLDVSKQIFDSFINRTLAYDFSVHIGLITFNSTANIAQEITHTIENFRQSLDSLSAVGDTALWDAIALADDQLSQYGQSYPDARKRIICLSDGADTKSTKCSHEVSLGTVQRKVVVDSFCLGYEDQELRTISHVSGGYKFCPKTLEQAMAICEMEPVLSQLERPPIRRKPLSPFNPRRSFEKATPNATPEIVTQDVYPARKEHENLKDSFVRVSTLAQSSRQSAMVPNTTYGAPRTSNTRPARLLSELKNVTANPHPYYEVFVSERNMGFWKVLMQGPPESDYAEGVFLLYLHMEDNYPAFPPKGRFCTPIFHPNINRHGRICHSILDRNWTIDTTNVQILNTIYSLLLVPEFSDPINTVVTLNYHWDQVAFQEEVKKHIQKHAAKSRDVLRAMVLEG